MASTSTLMPALAQTSPATPTVTDTAAPMSQDELDSLNQTLAQASPQEILSWAMTRFGSELYQTTAFGQSGTVALDMIHKINEGRVPQERLLVPLIYIDTLFAFPQTIAFSKRVTEHYHVPLHVYKPKGMRTATEFDARMGSKLWERDEDLYDYTVKVEPAQRAYAELAVKAVLTGRRKSQGGDRGSIDIVEIDSTGLIKINPLANWDYHDVASYVRENSVPYNPMLDEGYKSIGDWHSTRPVTSPRPSGLDPSHPPLENGSSMAADERAGRWAGREKTECGLHVDYFKMKKAVMKREREEEMSLRDEARDKEARESASPSPKIVETEIVATT